METKGRVFGLIAVGLVLALAGAGYAYDAMPTPEDLGLNYSVTAGVVSSVNGNINNGIRPTIGLNWYGAAEGAFGDMAAFGLSAEWIGLQRNDGKTVNLVPLLFNYKKSGMVGGYRVFVILGLGIQVASESIPEMRLGNGASFAWTGGMGVDITNSIYAQAKFIGGQNPGQDGLVSIDLGYRF
jgi:hypothetical protein